MGADKERPIEVERDWDGTKKPYLFKELESLKLAYFVERELFEKQEAEGADKQQLQLEVNRANERAVKSTFGIPVMSKLMRKEEINAYLNKMVEPLIEQAILARMNRNKRIAKALGTRCVDIVLALGQTQRAIRINKKLNFYHDMLDVWTKAETTGGFGDEAVVDWASVGKRPATLCLANVAFGDYLGPRALQKHLSYYAELINVQDAFIIATRRLGWEHPLTLNLFNRWKTDAALPKNDTKPAQIVHKDSAAPNDIVNAQHEPTSKETPPLEEVNSQKMTPDVKPPTLYAACDLQEQQPAYHGPLMDTSSSYPNGRPAQMVFDDPDSPLSMFSSDRMITVAHSNICAGPPPVLQSNDVRATSVKPEASPWTGVSDTQSTKQLTYFEEGPVNFGSAALRSQTPRYDGKRQFITKSFTRSSFGITPFDQDHEPSRDDRKGTNRKENYTRIITEANNHRAYQSDNRGNSFHKSKSLSSEGAHWRSRGFPGKSNDGSEGRWRNEGGFSGSTKENYGQ